MARSLGYDVTLYYIGLSSPEIAMDRVRRRVEHGGHDVPEPDVRRRFVRSLAELRVVASLVDRLIVLDNSGYPGYRLVLSREGGQTRKTTKLPAYLVELTDGL
jgi:predicted ABC-type ATPase